MKMMHGPINLKWAKVVRKWGAEEILYPKSKAVTREQTNCILNSCMIFYCSPDSFGARCWWCSWFRSYTTSRRITGSIPGGVTGIFH